MSWFCVHIYYELLYLPINISKERFIKELKIIKDLYCRCTSLINKIN